MKEKKQSVQQDNEQKIREQEMEIAQILMKADEIKEETFDFGIDGQIELKNEIADLILEQMDDPEAKYNLYYNVLNRLLRKYLPKGDENKTARDLIYEEKNIFLTRGHHKNEKGIRGADGRMAYVPDIQDMVNIITQWISNQGTVYELYIQLKELNVSKGYSEKE